MHARACSMRTCVCIRIVRGNAEETESQKEFVKNLNKRYTSLRLLCDDSSGNNKLHLKNTLKLSKNYFTFRVDYLLNILSRLFNQ